MSLMDIYLQLGGMDAADQEVVAEQVKEAAAQGEAAAETVKMAHDYDAAGRRLARALWGQQKLAGLGFPGKEEDETEKEREAEREGSENKPKAKKAPAEREDEGEGKEKKRSKQGDGDEDDDEEQEMAEKKASILARAAEDPEFAAKLLAWHQGS